MITIEQIRKRLSTVPAQSSDVDHHSPTAVALLLKIDDDGPAIFFIERAFDERDPWSGNIGFPGGRRESGDSDLQRTAERETLEEVGISLLEAELIGRLPDIVGANLPVKVSCFVYFLQSFKQPVLNAEVNDAFWLPLSMLANPAQNLTARVKFEGNTLEVPAIRLPQAGKAVLWGITYRLVNHFIDIVMGRTDKSNLKGSCE
jgi:8-oxo-dGTP pyrophosphatase MutT (NUDIX family)